jgi:hypothetical protein
MKAITTKTTTYTYSVEMSINEGEALITVDGTNGETEAGAMFVVDAEGNLTCDTDSDGCSNNPFDEQGWPEPPANYITEAKELAVATISEEEEEGEAR